MILLLDEIPIVVEAAIGVATLPEHASDASMLLQQADIAMYYAKQMASGYAIYTPEYNLHTPERLGLLANKPALTHSFVERPYLCS